MLSSLTVILGFGGNSGDSFVKLCYVNLDLQFIHLLCYITTLFITFYLISNQYKVNRFWWSLNKEILTCLEIHQGKIRSFV